MDILLFYLADLLFFGTLILNLFTRGKETFKKWRRFLPFLASALIIVGLLYRGVTYSRLPFSSLFEFSVLLIPLLNGGFYLLSPDFSGQNKIPLLNSFLSSFALLAILQLPSEAVAPMPALQSPWMWIHVTTALVAYTAFGCAFGLSVNQLLQKKDYDEGLYQKTLKALHIGFFFQTLLLITGSMWAEETWGRYWAWDPKESWALITWFFYATLIHFESRGKHFKWTAISCIIAFIVVLITLFGVTLLIPGLHAY